MFLIHSSFSNYNNGRKTEKEGKKEKERKKKEVRKDEGKEEESRNAVFDDYL